MSEQSRLATRAVGKLFVVPAGALPVSVSMSCKSLYTTNRRIFSGPRPDLLPAKAVLLPSAQLLPISPVPRVGGVGRTWRYGRVSSPRIHPRPLTSDSNESLQWGACTVLVWRGVRLGGKAARPCRAVLDRHGYTTLTLVLGASVQGTSPSASRRRCWRIASRYTLATWRS